MKFVAMWTSIVANEFIVGAGGKGVWIARFKGIGAFQIALVRVEEAVKDAGGL